MLSLERVGPSRAETETEGDGARYSSNSVMVVSSICACETARGAGSVRRPGPGVNIALVARGLLAEGGASIVGLLGSEGRGVVAKVGKEVWMPKAGVWELSTMTP